MAPLKLTALDAEDLGIISAHMQDAVVKLGAVSHLERGKQFALIANRFAWMAENPERRRTGLRFARVLGVKSSRIRQGDSEAILSLLAIAFEPGDPPSGAIVLTFSGGGAIRLEVECIEAELRDLGPAWAAARQPEHDG